MTTAVPPSPASRAPRRRSQPPARDAHVPQYELRVQRQSGGESAYEIWQLPAPATPHLRQPRRVAGLAGKNLRLIEYRVLRQLRLAGISPAANLPGEEQRFPLPEDDALRLGLLFRTLAPMRNRDYMLACTQGIEAMGREEAGYWLGMAMHRRHPRRILMALRILLIDPKQHGRGAS